MLQRQGRAREALREQLRAIALQPGAVAEGREYARTETRVEGGGGGPVARVKTDGRSNHGESTYYLSAEHESSNAGRPPHQRQSYQRGRHLRGAGLCEPHLRVLRQRSDGEARAARRGSGRGVPEDPDFRSLFTGAEANYIARFPTGGDSGVTTKVAYRYSSLQESNPDSLLADAKPFQREAHALPGTARRGHDSTTSPRH